MGRVRNFLIQSYLSYKGLFHWLNWWSYLSNVFFSPLLIVAIVGLTGRFAGLGAEARGYVVGMAAVSAPAIVFGGIIQSFGYERSFGTLALIFGSPGHRLGTYLSRAILHVPNGAASMASCLIFAWLGLGIDLSGSDWLALCAAGLSVILSCAAFGLFMGNVALVYRDFVPINMAAYGIMLVLSGVVIPVTRLPLGLFRVSEFLPLTHGLVGLRQALNGVGATSIGVDLAREMAVGLAYALVGFVIFRVLEQVAKRRGTYEFSG